MIPRRIFWLMDLAVLIVAFWAAYQWVPGLRPLLTSDGLLGARWLQALAVPVSWTGQLPPMRNLLWILVATAPIALLMLGAVGNHRPLLSQSRTRVLFGSFLAPLVGLSFSALSLLTLKADPVSRSFLFMFALLSGLGFAVYRLFLRGYFFQRQASGVYVRNILLIGLPSGIEWMVHYFAEYVQQYEYRLLGYLDTDHDSSKYTETGDAHVLPNFGRVEHLGDLLIHRPIHEVVAVQPASGGEWVAQVITDCDYFGILLRIVPEPLLFGERHALETLYPFEPLHLPAVVLRPPHWDSDALFLKRLFDIVVAGLLLVLLSPIFGIIALILKFSDPDAPVFYPWRVVGQNGVSFTGYKFRTMVQNADALKAELLNYNEMTGPVFKMKNDPRVTPIGRILRKFSLDELPQLWSVLKGDMSLVGPRPAGPHELVRYEFWHKRKLSIRPGMTCLWQIRGRNAINNFDEWVKMDLEYIDKWSLWLDFKILVGTAWAVITGTGV